MIDSTGTTRARYEHDAYGRRNKVSGDLEADFAFTGHYFHGASGLHLTLFRAYDADSGRWLNRDPLEEEGGLNLYGYVLNNPLNYFDPLGLSWGSAAGSFVWGAGTSAAYAYTVGFLVIGATSVAVAPVLAFAAGATAIIAAGYGGFQLGMAIYELTTGREWSWDGNGKILCDEDYIDRAAGFLGSLVGGGAVGGGFMRGGESKVPGQPWGLVRIAPFGNRTGNKYGEFPHYHRRIPHPNPKRAAKGESAPGGSKDHHRPHEGGW
jgi:RHS repeat-associated protein